MGVYTGHNPSSQDDVDYLHLHDSQSQINLTINQIFESQQKRITDLEARFYELNDVISEKVLPALLEVSAHVGDDGLGSVVKALVNAVGELQNEYDAPASRFTHYLPVAIRRAENEG